MEHTFDSPQLDRLDGLDALLEPILAALFDDPAAGLPSIAGADILSDIWNAVSRLISFPVDMVGYFYGKFQDVLNWVTSTTGNIKDFVVARVDWVKTQLENAISGVYNFVTSIPGAVSSAGSWVIDQVKSALGAGWDFISNLITWLLDQVKSGLSAGWDFISGLVNWLLGVLRDLISAAGKVAADVGLWLWGLVQPAVSAAGKVAADVGLWLWNLTSSAFTFANNNISNAANWVAGQTFNYVIQGAAALGDGFQSALDWLINSAFGSVVNTMRDIMSVPWKMLHGAYTGVDGILTDLHLGDPTGGFASFMYSAAAMIPTLVSLVSGLGPIYAADALQHANQIVGPTMLSLTDARDAWLRGLLNDGGLDDVLGRAGYNDIKKGILKELFFEPAPPSDLVRFLVREVFDPQQRQSLGLDADYPAAADAEGRKVGLAPQTMRNYWAAHWQLPSPSQVYEMLHRGQIDGSAVDAYLKAADYSPAWRSKLASISYNVPGRIDLRRMFAAGTIDEARLLRGYKDLGYNDADAAIMTGFAKKLAGGTPKDLPRGVILDGYREGDMDRSEAMANLESLHYLPEDASFMLDLEDLTKAKELRLLGERAVGEDFKVGVMTEGQAITQLGLLGTTSARARALVNLWEAQQLTKAQRLSVAELQHAVREKLLPEPVALQRLKALGFNDGDAQMLITLAHPKAPQHTPPTLTLSHLFTGLRRGVFNQAQLMERLTLHGYSREDAAFLVELATPDLLPSEPAELTKAELIAAVKKKTLPVDAVQRRLAAKGYSAQDVDTLLRTQGFEIAPTGTLVSYPRRDLTVAQLSKSFRTGLIEEKELRFRLAELAYADADIDLLVELAAPAVPNG